MGSRIDVSHYSGHGLIEGRIMHCRWFALVQPEPTSFGINPRTLLKGGGRVSRLCIYTGSKSREVVAEYSRGWVSLKYNYIQIVEELVDYLERRYSLMIVK